MRTNNEMIKEYITTRGLKPKTLQSYTTVLQHYSKFQNKNLNDLINEADFEEEQRIRWKKRKLKKRLVTYGNFCKDNMKITSAKNYVHVVKCFYHHHEIEIGSLPSLNLRNSEINDPITYADLPDHEIIRKAVEISNPLMRSLILYLCSSGLSRVDALSLTVMDFVNATSEYHDGGSISVIIETLLNSDVDIIPVFRARRKKTNKYFISFCTPEAVREICYYLKDRNDKKPLKFEDKLFKISPQWYTIKFGQINDALGLGNVGAYRRFRGHMLRKFHASNLEKAGMDRYKINVIQGKSNGAVDDVYFFHDESDLKNDYVKCMHQLLIVSDVNEVDVYSDEYLQVLNENKKLQSQVDRIRQLESDVENIKSWYILD